MPLQLISGDLFQSDLQSLAHGCNCKGVMGKGIAKEFRQRWPNMYQEYRKRCQEGLFRPGDVFAWEEGDITIFNLATQETPGPNADLSAIDQAIRKMIEIAVEKKIKKVGLPRIGSGIGGLNWSDVHQVLERIAVSTPVTLVVFEKRDLENK